MAGGVSCPDPDVQQQQTMGKCGKKKAGRKESASQV